MPPLLVVYGFKSKRWSVFFFSLFFQDKKLDKQYEQTTKSLFFPSVSRTTGPNVH